MINIICALAANRAIGYNNKLLYHLSADLRRFKALTTGHTVIMGRRTFESLPKGALPNRRNIVLSRQTDLAFAGAEVFLLLKRLLLHVLLMRRSLSSVVKVFMLKLCHWRTVCI